MILFYLLLTGNRSKRLNQIRKVLHQISINFVCWKNIWKCLYNKMLGRIVYDFVRQWIWKKIPFGSRHTKLQVLVETKTCIKMSDQQTAVAYIYKHSTTIACEIRFKVFSSKENMFVVNIPAINIKRTCLLK